MYQIRPLCTAGADSLRGLLNQVNMPSPLPVTSSRELVPLLDLPERKGQSERERSGWLLLPVLLLLRRRDTESSKGVIESLHTTIYTDVPVYSRTLNQISCISTVGVESFISLCAVETIALY